MKIKILFILLIIFASCKNTSNNNANSEYDKSEEYVNDESENTELFDDESENEVNEGEENESEYENFSETKSYDDGTYDASVDYYNPKTGYSATYNLEVDVEDGEVVRINFPKGGWLDDDIHPTESRLSPAELDEDGEATMEDENGRTFEIKIDN